MTYNSTIVLKGMQKPIFASKINALSVQKTLSDNAIPFDFVIQIGNQSFRKGDIKFVEVINDGDDSRKNDEYMHEFYDNERKEREYLVAKTAEYKASKLDIFLYLYYFATNNNPTSEVLEKAKQIQFNFFKDHPKRTLCDLHLLKEAIPGLDHNTPNAVFKETAVLFRTAYFRLVEKAVYRDMQLSGQLKSPIPYPKLKEAEDNESITDMKDRSEYNRKQDKNFDDLVAHAVNNF